MDPEPLLGTLGVKWEYTLDEVLGIHERGKNICELGI